MTGLMTYQGGLLLANGGLTTDADCCCNPPPPPPPPCACPQTPCTPPGQWQFSGIKAVVEIDDQMLLTEDVTDLVLGGTDCTCKPNDRHIEVRLSGMSAANGTYDAAYVKYSGGGLIEADPLTECGLWFFPHVDIEISYYHLSTQVFPDACRPYFEFIDSRTIDAYVDTYFGTIVAKIGTVPDFTLTQKISGIIPYNYTYAMYSSVWTPYACKPSDSSVTFTERVSTTLSTGGSFSTIAFRNSHPSGPAVAATSGIGTQTMIDTYNGQSGTLRPFNNTNMSLTFGNSCVISWQSVETNIDAMFERIDTPRTRCPLNNPLPLPVAFPGFRELQHNSFRRKHSILLNA